MRPGYLLRDVINKVRLAASISLQTKSCALLARSRNRCSARCAMLRATLENFTRLARALVRFMVTVTDPRFGETVLDPASGTAQPDLRELALGLGIVADPHP